MRHIVFSFVLVSAALLACGSTSRSIDDGSSGGGPGSSGGTPPGALGSSGASSSGSSGDATCAADIVAATRAQVDIIIVIDTSGSMTEESVNVNANLNKFATSIGSTGLDYRVVVIADKPPPFVPPGLVPGVCIPAPLGGAMCADNPPSFHQIATTVDSNDSLQIILDQFPTYEPWLRPTAYKLFIEVTDDNSEPLQWSDFDAKLLAKSPMQFGDATKRRYIFDSICGWAKSTPVLSPGKCSSAVNTGDQYQHLSQLTDGIVDSVCEKDFSGVFDNLAKGLVTKLGCEFQIPSPKDGSPADPTKVVVTYTPASGGPMALTQVTDPSKCGSVPNAWYYDNAAAPTKIEFCPSTCSGVGADTSGKLSIALGCKAPEPK